MYRKRKKCLLSYFTGFFILSLVILGEKEIGFCSANPVREQSFTSFGTGTTVSVSTSAWTPLPTASSLSGRQGIIVTNDEANTSMMALLFSTQSSSPSEAITVHTMYVPVDSAVVVGIPAGLYLYGLYLGASAANAHVKEYVQ